MAKTGASHEAERAGPPNSAAAPADPLSNPALAREMLHPGSAGFWHEDDMAAIFRHELTCPVELELGAVHSGMAAQLATVAAARGLLLRSFADLLRHPNPPVELLVLVKQFAKSISQHPDSPLPRQVANVLYYLSLSAARVRCGRRITELDDASFRQGLGWCLEQPWVVGPERELLCEGLARLAQTGGTP
jgi:hypothetical protein